MTGAQIIFILVALFTLGSGLMVVTTRNLVHAALWLVSTLFGVAVTFALLNASFLAVVQVVVYIGAIAILFVFAGLFFLLQGWGGLSKTQAAIPAGFDAISELGNALVSPDAFVLPFEVAS